MRMERLVKLGVERKENEEMQHNRTQQAVRTDFS
jgi:hypothetical protein